MPWQNNILMLQIVWCKNLNNIARKDPSPLSDNGSFWATFFCLFENRIGKQNLVIYCTSHLYGSLGNHKLYCTVFLSTLAWSMILRTMNPAENLAHLLSFHTVNPSLSVVWQIYHSPVSSSCAKLTRPPSRIPSSIDIVFDR